MADEGAGRLGGEYSFIARARAWPTTENDRLHGHWPTQAGPHWKATDHAGHCGRLFLQNSFFAEFRLTGEWCSDNLYLVIEKGPLRA